jgi:hypothetical protein
LHANFHGSCHAKRSEPDAQKKQGDSGGTRVDPTLALTPFCMVLFGDLLNLPIPVFPQALAELFPADWSQKAVLRATAATLLIAAIIAFFSGRPRPGRQIDVASDHSEGKGRGVC